jgi:hypothetical protein
MKRKSYHITKFLLVFLFTLLVSSQTFALKNAYHWLEKVESDGKARISGVRGVGNWSNPPLNNGYASYHRIALYNSIEFRFIEVGWVKRRGSPTFSIEGVWGEPNDPSENGREVVIAPAGNYQFEIYLYVSSGAENFHVVQARNLNTGILYPVKFLAKSDEDGLNANKGTHMIVGGETIADTTDTEEEMVGPIGPNYYGTSYVNLKWQNENSAGQFVWNNWKNPVEVLRDNPYWSLYVGYNQSFGGMLEACGKRTAQDCPIPPIP